MLNHTQNKDQRGASMAEMAIVAGVFFMVIIGVIEFGRLLYTHNALTDAARRGARYAVLHNQSETCVENVAIYGETHLNPDCTPQTGAKALIKGLTATNVSVQYSGDFKLNSGMATVSITGYTFNLGIPFIRRTLNMPAYITTLTAESAGDTPNDIIAP